MATASSRPYLLFFPYLHSLGSYDLGPWQMGPLRDYQGPWLSAEFERMSKDFLSAFRDARGKPLDNIYLLSHRVRGVDGRLPTRPQRVAIQRAIDFAVLDKTPSADDPNAGLWSATSDNSELFIWPIDVEHGYVTLSRGSMVREYAGGHKVGEELIIPAPLELQMPWNLALDSELLAAMYHLFTRRLSGDEDRTRRRIETAISWLAKAWRNSPSIGMDERVVFLKTGFEALAGTSDTKKCVACLRKLYEEQLGGIDAKYLDNLIWSSNERRRFTRTYTKNGQSLSEVVTDFEHWFWTFCDARNCIIHDGVTPKLTYRARASRYNGSLVNTGERLLRESVKVAMIRLGYPHLWRGQVWQAVHKMLQRSAGS